MLRMFSLIALSTLFLVGEPLQNQPAAAALKNEDILALHADGFSDGVVIAKIKTSVCAFDTSPVALGKLKASGISEGVVLAMIGAGSSGSSGSKGPEVNKPSKAEAQATLHFYCERAFAGGGRKMPIFIDELQVADLVNGRHFTMMVQPGRHTFRCRTRPEAIRIDIEPGQEYYMRAELIQGFTKNRWRVIQMSKEQGVIDVQKLKPLDVEHISPAARSPE